MFVFPKKVAFVVEARDRRRTCDESHKWEECLYVIKKGEKKKLKEKREEEIIRSVCCLCSSIIIDTQYATLGLLLYSAASTLTFNRRVSIVYIMLIINFANK